MKQFICDSDGNSSDLAGFMEIGAVEPMVIDHGTEVSLAGTGLEVIDIDQDPTFLKRDLHQRDADTQMIGIQRLARAFVENPNNILQELVETAVDLCGAESAGISVQMKDKDGAIVYHWVATAGKYAHFLNAMLPSFPSACGLCIERGKPQIFRVSKLFFDLMGIEADVVTDGLLLPWHVGETHGTIWIMAHGKEEAFDSSDCRVLQSLADFAAIGVRQQRQQQALIDQASAAAAAAMANDLAHRINNPLQSLTNIAYLATEGDGVVDMRAMARDMSADLERLSSLVKKLLELPMHRRV
ncbi:GAF domain-containing protein [Acidobacterium sp. S8]|uniref:GAF domain-containing protein n=1 Tax=Acidobacterium sp. S8 TaxID=1641854 RepID=UPI0020B15F53|nr:GAF domain-containing protein [Acidobacterium sp. S8]